MAVRAAVGDVSGLQGQKYGGKSGGKMRPLIGEALGQIGFR